MRKYDAAARKNILRPPHRPLKKCPQTEKFMPADKIFMFLKEETKQYCINTVQYKIKAEMLLRRSHYPLQI